MAKIIWHGKTYYNAKWAPRGKYWYIKGRPMKMYGAKKISGGYRKKRWY